MKLRPEEAPRNIAALVKSAARKKVLFLPHAIAQMSRPDRMITVKEVRSTLMRGEIIEDYPEDARGHSCLILGKGESGRAVHVICAPKEDYLAIITAYLPGKDEWSRDFRTRRQT